MFSIFTFLSSRFSAFLTGSSVRRKSIARIIRKNYDCRAYYWGNLFVSKFTASALCIASAALFLKRHGLLCLISQLIISINNFCFTNTKASGIGAQEPPYKYLAWQVIKSALFNGNKISDINLCLCCYSLKRDVSLIFLFSLSIRLLAP